MLFHLRPGAQAANDRTPDFSIPLPPVRRVWFRGAPVAPDVGISAAFPYSRMKGAQTMSRISYRSIAGLAIVTAAAWGGSSAAQGGPPAAGLAAKVTALQT